MDLFGSVVSYWNLLFVAEVRDFMNRKGVSLLTENIIFITINLAFLTIVLLFVFSRMNGAAPLEELYAKNIALAIDAARPESQIIFNVEDAITRAQKEGQDLEKIITISENVVNVKLDPNGVGYGYSFFSDVNVSAFLKLNNNGERTGEYVLNIK